MSSGTYERTFLEFFAGIGLIHWALHNRGWRCLFANDLDPAKQQIYADNFSCESYVLKDVHELDADEVPSAALATAGFPCTDLSLAGDRKGLRGKQSGAFWGFTGILEKMGDRRPPLILIENVPGFISSHGGSDFRAAISELNRLGYRCDPFIVDATHFVPQSRRRLFVVGALDALGVMTPLSEALLHSESELRPPLLRKFIEQHRDLKWSLRFLPRPPETKTRLPEVLEEPPDDDPIWWNTKRVEYLLAQMTPAHRREVDRMVPAKNPAFATVYRRMRHGQSMAELRSDGISGCLRTPRGGSSRQILVKACGGKVSVRYMTAREYARLQGVDESFEIKVSLNQGLFGFGDAVCVPVIRWIFDNYVDPLYASLLHSRELGARGHQDEGTEVPEIASLQRRDHPLPTRV